MNRNSVTGVDGCRGGWLAVSLDSDGGHRTMLHGTITDLWQTHHEANVILIDIPIGLTSGNGIDRNVDSIARSLLKPLRHPSIFTRPCRKALAAKTYAEACRINQAVCGRKISIQTWHIMPKIREVDVFLRKTPAAKGVLRETHPEICFWALAGGSPATHSKKSAAGRNERLNLLQQVYPRARGIYQAALEGFPRRWVARDDIIDALGNAVTATRMKASGATLPEDPSRDRFGLPMEMAFVRPEKWHQPLNP